MEPYEVHNFRFTPYQHGDNWVVDVQRISDGHRLSPQLRLADEPDEVLLEAVAEAWILDKAGNNEPKPMFCARCGERLVSDHDTTYQFDNALWMTFTGGYDMFIDPFGDDRQSPKAVLCHDCAHLLCSENPWLEQLLDPYHAHAHTQAYHDAHPDHLGWDYDREDGNRTPTQSTSPS